LTLDTACAILTLAENIHHGDDIMKSLTRNGALAISGICAVLLLIIAVITVKFFGDNSFDALPAATLHDNFIVVSKDDSISTTARQAFVYDIEADCFILLKGEEKVIYPASTTKLMTALMALRYLSPDEIITCGEEVSFIESGSSVAYVKEGMQLTVEMLIEGMLIPSGNDAAYAIAAAAGRRIANDDSISSEDAVEVFVAEMNRYGKEIGLCGSSFCVPDGYYGDEHYTTLEDMLIISRLAYENELIMKYACMPSHEVTYESGEQNLWLSTNYCLDLASEYYSPYITGLKTGSLDDYYNIICTATDGNDSYIIGLFGLENKDSRYAQAQKIANELFE